MLAEIHQFALIGLSSSLHSEACNALGASDEVIQSAGGDPSVCAHGVEAVHCTLKACNALGASDEDIQSAGGDLTICCHGVGKAAAL